ncbi:MAG: NUDIX hydrolase [Firmicutes bacterium]|nr:NUDIX hydrolase [Bacillota bacterium]
METPQGPGKTVFSGKALSVRVDPVSVKGRETSREVVQRAPAVGIIAETADRRLVVIRQFRWAVGHWLWELPAGVVNPGEDPLATAKRELAEETGYHTDSWQFLFRYYPSPGYTNEEIHLFYASQVRHGTPHPDPDEEITVELWDKERLRQQLRSSATLTSIWLIGVQWWLALPQNQ